MEIREVSKREKSVCLQVQFAWNQTSLGKFPFGKALDKYNVQKKRVEHFYTETNIFFKLLELAGFSQPQLSLPKGSFNLKVFSNLK